MSEIKPGSYAAKVIAYGAKKTQAGDGAIVIQFGFESEGESHTLAWQGSLKNTGTGKKTGLQITLETLEICGFDFNHADMRKNFDKIALGTSAGVLDTDKEVSIKVEMEQGQDGNMYPRVKWVNKLGGGAFKNMMTIAEASQAFNNVTGDIMAFASKKGNMIASFQTQSPEDIIPF